jgi:hypothetical protein
MARTPSSTRIAPDAPAAGMAALFPAQMLIGQKVLAEATRFWAHRMRAYATYAESLCECQAPGDLIAAQSRFLEQMQTDYAAENGAMTAILASSQAAVPRGDGAEAH